VNPDKAGTRFSYPGEMQGSVDLCYVKADLLGFELATCQSQVQRPTAAPTRLSNSVTFKQEAQLSHKSSAIT